MRYYRLPDSEGYRLVAEDDDGVRDLTAADSDLDRFVDLARAAAAAGTSIDEVAATLRDGATEVSRDRLADAAIPVRAEEVWAAGVTYAISEEAREAESGLPEIYLDVYEVERPEIFFKATPSRTVGTGDAVGVRGDSDWNVPEPELGIVLYEGEVVGFTVGNDVSSRSIEGANPLYLPQAKVYDRCCSIGPCISSPDYVGNPHDLTMSMRINRGDDLVYEGATSTSEMVRTCEELVGYWTRHNVVPEMAVLLTGTSLVPDDEFTLLPDDEVRIEINRIGVLENPVISV